MQPTSPAQSAASTAFGVPDLELVRDDTWALGQPMPGEHLRASLLYLLRDAEGGFHVVDPGTDSDENWERLVDALASLDATPSDIRSIAVTHLHADHLGMAPRIRRLTGARLGLHEADLSALHTLAAHPPTPATVEARAREWGVPAARLAELRDTAASVPPVAVPDVDDLLRDGDRLDVPGREIRVVHTPGHTPGHLSLRDVSNGLIFTGDHLLPHVFGGLGLGGPSDTNALADSLASLDRVAAHPGDEVLPGHGFRFTGVVERAAESAQHHLRRTAEVEAAVAADPEASVWSIAATLTWTAGWENLAGFSLWSALSQTAMHRDYVAMRERRRATD